MSSFLLVPPVQEREVLCVANWASCFRVLLQLFRRAEFGTMRSVSGPYPPPQRPPDIGAKFGVVAKEFFINGDCSSAR